MNHAPKSSLCRLPVDTVLSDLKSALSKGRNVVLQAPPGAGKTTRVPLSILTEPWLNQQKILLLSPRRLAARTAAARMAETLGEPVGKTIGYRIRMESRISAYTRIEVVTEGILTRILQRNSELNGIGLVIFDEFHERSLDADLGLALCLDVQEALQPNLRLLIMSATLNTESIAALLPNAPVITCQGRTYPVQTRYLDLPSRTAVTKVMADAVITACHNEEGSILAFLPGAKEIRQVATILEDKVLDSKLIIAPLYGSLSHQRQQQAILPAPKGKRKIVLASAIAETSLTIEGIRVVIDSGLSRLPQYDAGSGMTRLVTLPVSQASAEQRRGRAGRTQPGVCYRLWPEAIHCTLPPAHRPEIKEADLSALMLNLLLWGVPNPQTLKWLDPPPKNAVDNALELLVQLNAISPDRRPTPKGRKMADLPVHPRLASMLLGAVDIGRIQVACDLAALLSERDPLQFFRGPREVDLRLRMEVLNQVRSGTRISLRDVTFDIGLYRRIIKVSDYLHQKLGEEDTSPDQGPIGELLALAFPDRIAQKRPVERGRYLLRNGRGAVISPDDPLAAWDYLVAAELDGDRQNARIFLAAGYDTERLTAQFSGNLETVVDLLWDSRQKVVRAIQKKILGALVIESRICPDVDSKTVTSILIEGIRREGLDCLPWNQKQLKLRVRVAFLKNLFSDEKWPDFSDEALLATLDTWLAPYLDGMSRIKDLSHLDLTRILTDRLSWSQQQALEELAPTHYQVPSGSRIPIDYSSQPPVLAVRVQELFGCRQTPVIANGRAPLILHLLSPAGRPVQITQDLAGFWQSSYAAVKKEMKGRYPKHPWPDDPLTAIPTFRTKGRKRS